MYSQWRRRWRGSVEYAQSLGCGSRWLDPGGGDWWRRTLRRLPRSPCLFLPLDPCPAACHPLALSSTPPGRSPPRPSRWPVVLGRLLFQQVSTEKGKVCWICVLFAYALANYIYINCMGNVYEIFFLCKTYLLLDPLSFNAPLSKPAHR